MKDFNSIGAAIKRLRESKGLTQEELAKTSGVSLSSITKIESGAIKSLSREAIKKLSSALNYNKLLLLQLGLSLHAEYFQ